MTDEIQWLLTRSKDGIKATELMISNDLHHSAVSEGYYAMFYLAQALILDKGRNASTHKGVLTLFSALYVKTGEMDRSFSVMLANAFAARGKADYEIGIDIDKDEAKTVLADARTFYEAARQKLQTDK